MDAARCAGVVYASDICKPYPILGDTMVTPGDVVVWPPLLAAPSHPSSARWGVGVVTHFGQGDMIHVKSLPTATAHVLAVGGDGAYRLDWL